MSTERKIKLWCFASIDGFISRTDGDADFITEHSNPTKQDYGFKAFFDSVDCAVMNRTHYINLQSNEVWSVADKPCHVATRENFFTPPDQDIHFIFAGSDNSLAEQIEQLRQQSGGDIWVVGDHDLISCLIKRGMMDEITVNILPLTLGCGLPLFIQNGKETKWQLVGSQFFDNGVVQNKYRVFR